MHWLDLFNRKYQLMSEKFMNETNKVSTADGE